MALRISRVTTKSGDDGRTFLGGGERVPKDHVRIEALGAIDELNCHLGVLRANGKDSKLYALVPELQQDLFDLGALIAGSDRPLLDDTKIERLEEQIAEYNASLPPLEEFVLPGGSATGAQWHIARAVCRRAERRLATLAPDLEQGRVYLNRLSDLLFVLARVADSDSGKSEVLWRGGKSA